MIRGRVIGQAWATRRAAGLSNQTMLLVAEEGSKRVLLALDILDARVGDRVLVSMGSGARNVLAPGPHNRHLLCDAAVSQVVDGSSDPLPRQGA